MADDEQRETIAFLSEGASYGRPGLAVERIDTHVSVVFLVGDRVYKLKRAVATPYLDYSTVARREQCCRAEVALNRRTAPSLYLGVRGVTRAPGGLALDGAGEAVDWLVEMRRFDQEGLFDRLAERRQLTPPLMRDLADAIAGFHAVAEPSHGHGGAAAMAAVIAGNGRSFAGTGAALDPGEVAALEAGQRAALGRVADLLNRRREAGLVRRCHGDLHLRNICLLDGRPTLFDGIEFSDDIAVIDVLYDLAFLLMDLEHRGLGALGNLVFNRYLDRTGDSGGLAALPLFLSLRAAIRAHVSATSALRQSDTAAASGLGAEAQGYLRLGRRLLGGTAPRLVAVGGLSGSGKSTLAAALAPDLAPPPGARILRSDSLRKRLAGIAPEVRLPPAAYTREANERVYRALRDEAAAALAAGRTVILDAAFLRADERAAAAKLAEAAGVPFQGLWLAAPKPVLAARLAGRGGDASDADLRVLEQQLTYEIGRLDWTPVEAAGDAAAALAAARRALGISRPM